MGTLSRIRTLSSRFENQIISHKLISMDFTSLTMLMYPKMSGWSGDLTFVPWEKEQTSLDSVFLVTYIPTGVLLLIVSFLFTPFICLCLLNLY